MKSVLYYDCKIIIKENSMNLFRTITVVLLVTWTSAHAAAKRLDSTGETWNRTAADAGYDMDQAPVRRYVGVLITGQSTQGDEMPIQ